MKIYIDIDPRDKKTITVRNRAKFIDVLNFDLDKNRLDFSILKELKGEKILLDRAFKEVLFEETQD
jgi:hypothetical protein